MFELLAFGTLWFWLFISVCFIAITAFVENGYPGRATTSAIIFCVALYFFGGKDVLSWLVMNPFDFLRYTLIYFFLGAVYCVYKWWRFSIRKRIDVEKEIKKGYASESDATPPVPSDYYSELTGWVIYWPFSGLWTLINDPIQRLAELIVTQIEVLLQKISNHVFKDIKIEVPKNKEKK